MDITFLGHASFKIKGKRMSVVTDPFDERIGKFPKTDAEVVTVSHQHGDHNMVDKVTGTRKVIEGPGEYEISGTSFIGVPSFHDEKKGELRGKNIIFVIEMDGLKVAHLGDLGHMLSDKQVEQIGRPDVLLIPVGGVYTIDAKTAVDVVQALEPKIIVPMHFQVKGLALSKTLGSLEDFLAIIEIKVVKEKRLKLNAATLSPDGQTVYVLEKR